LDAVFFMRSESYNISTMLVLPGSSCLLWWDYGFDRITAAIQEAKGWESLSCLRFIILQLQSDCN
jgi:hypothetical protein